MVFFCDIIGVLWKNTNIGVVANLTAARLAQLGERWSAEREAIGSNPGRTNT